jgi:ubiquinone/menaquinone biosynthesis C-methylase UbiE
VIEIRNHQNQTYSETKKSIFYTIFKKIISDARHEFFSLFCKHTNYTDKKSIIDVGTTPSLTEEQNIFIENTKNNPNVTCFSNQDCKILQKKYSNIKKILIGDGRDTKLADNSFDIVHSNATIEHVGSFENQIKFVKEMLRISREAVFIQTPNRYYPIDFHTILPFIHWLPKNLHRKILKILKLNFYSVEENLNLISENDLKKICENLKIKDYEILKYNLFFIPSNLILVIKKNRN